MDCVNHPGREAKSFCQNCGKPMCAECVRRTPSGHILCEQCLMTQQPGANQEFWQAAQAFVANAQGVPNPSAAAVLGLIPGVGAMYNGQLFKGLIHVVIFAVLISMTQSYGVFGVFIGAWVLYQSFEAYQTAKARRDGTPLPDPFGLNELGGWLNLGGTQRGQNAGVPPRAGAPQPGAPSAQPGSAEAVGQSSAQQGSWADPAAPAAEQTGAAAGVPPAYGAPYTPPAGGWSSNPGAYPGQYPGSYQSGPYQGGSYQGGSYQGGPYSGANPTPGYTTPPYAEPYTGYGANPDPYAGSYPPGSYPPGNYPPGYVPPIPPIPPVPPSPYGLRGREPAWAIILIFLGLAFLFKTTGFIGHLFHYGWPILLIAGGIWLIVHHAKNTQGGPK